jgi:hypothetical protein
VKVVAQAGSVVVELTKPVAVVVAVDILDRAVPEVRALQTHHYVQANQDRV